MSILASRPLSDEISAGTEMEALLTRCEKLDLTKNIFVDGKWGSFR